MAKFLSTKNYYILPDKINDYQLDIWNKFLGTSVELEQRFTNPTRIDRHAGAILKEKNGYIRLFDSSSSFHSLTVYEAIMKRYNISYIEALKKAWFELLKGKATKYTAPEKKSLKRRCKIRFEQRSWNILDKKFWNGKTNITSNQLEKELTFPVDKYSYTNKNGVWVNHIPKSNTFHNTVNNTQKIYTPEYRIFKTNMNSSSIGGLKPFEFELGQPKILLLTMNQKSYLCNSNLGYNSRYLPHEGIHIPLDIMKKWNNTFDYILSIMDNDLTGLLSNNQMYTDWKKEINNDKFIQASFPKVTETYLNVFNQEKEVSDSYDYCKAFDLKRLDQEIQEILFNNL